MARFNLLFVASLLQVFLSASASAHPPQVGRFDASTLHPRTEQVLEAAFAHQLVGKAGQHPVPEAELYLQELVDRIAAAPKNLHYTRGLKFEVILAWSSEVNAMAAPDGRLIVEEGLLRLLPTDGHVAAILAHEMAHVIRCHSARSCDALIRTSRPQDLPGEAPEGMVVSEGSSLGSEGMDAFRISRQFLTTRKLGRAFEFEADAVALELLDNAEINPRYLPSALQQMENHIVNSMYKLAGSATPFRDRIFGTRGARRWLADKVIDRVSEACATHPKTCVRNDTLREEIKRHDYAHARGALKPASPEFLKIVKLLIEHSRG